MISWKINLMRFSLLSVLVIKFNSFLGDITSSAKKCGRFLVKLAMSKTYGSLAKKSREFSVRYKTQMTWSTIDGHANSIQMPSPKTKFQLWLLCKTIRICHTDKKTVTKRYIRDGQSFAPDFHPVCGQGLLQSRQIRSSEVQFWFEEITCHAYINDHAHKRIHSWWSCSTQGLFCINTHPVIRGLWGPGMHENCHYLKIYLNLVLGFHVILKNVAWYHFWMFLYSVGELKNNYFEFNENCT